MHRSVFKTEVPLIVKRRRFNLATCVLAAFCIPGLASRAQQTNHPRDISIPAEQLLRPAELVQILHSSSGEKPLVLQVGSHVMFTEAHIPGSEYAGAAGQESGLKMLRQRVQDLPRDRFIVIYCGCCPWPKCPNIRPAYRRLISMGFTHVKALYLEDNFGADWVARGYPVAMGG